MAGQVDVGVVADLTYGDVFQGSFSTWPYYAKKMQCAFLAFPRVTELKVASDVNERLIVPHGLPPLQDIVRFRELYKEGKEILR